MANKKVKDIKDENVELDGLELEQEPKVKKVVQSEANDDEYVELTVEDRIVNIEKKVSIIFVLVIITVCLGIGNALLIVDKVNGGNSTTTDTTQEESGYDTSKFDEITGADIEKESKDETIVVLIARQTCGYCVKYAPIISSVQDKYGFKTKYIDLAKMIDMSSSTLSITDKSSYDGLFNVGVDKTCTTAAYDSNGNLIECKDFINSEFGATPLTLVIKNNKLLYGIAGYVDEATLSSALESVGFSA